MLTIALLLPGLIYVFLKVFGRNQFEVPVLHAESIIVPAECETSRYSVPYVVADSMLVAAGWKPVAVNILIADDTSAGGSIARIRDEFDSLEFNLAMLQSGRQDIATCGLLLQKPQNAVMVDDRGRIRGYYDLSDREDTDRLIMEMKIMLKAY